VKRLIETQRTRIRDQLSWIRVSDPDCVLAKRRVWINEEASTKTVSIHDENDTLFIRYNRNFVQKLSGKDIYHVLIHEAEHIKRCHSDRCGHIVELLSKEEIVRMFNIGADLEINQEIKCLGNAVQVGKGTYDKYQAGLTAEQYFVCVLHDRIEHEKVKESLKCARKPSK